MEPEFSFSFPGSYQALLQRSPSNFLSLLVLTAPLQLSLKMNSAVILSCRRPCPPHSVLEGSKAGLQLTL